jgi:hypothetical protein
MPGNPDKGLLIMPYSFDNNDTKMWFGQYASDDAFTQHAIDTFTWVQSPNQPTSLVAKSAAKHARERPFPYALSTIREEGLEGRPSYITVAFHSRWMGRPGRFQALKRIVEHMLQFDDVWFATREKHFAEVHPYEPEKFKKAKKIAGGINGATVNGNGITNGTNGVKH